MLACTVLAGPERVASWLMSGLGMACVASALAFRDELTEADAWRTGRRVPVSWARWAWVNLHKLPFAAMVLGALALGLWRLLAR